MSGQLESALVLQLTDAIKWESALGPVDATGQLTQVDPNAPLDTTQYARRDRELAYRDLINAAAVVKVSLQTETVWNAADIRPDLQGLTTEVLPPTPGDLGRVNSQVVHVKHASVPKDALDTDKDLAGRDALLFEVLSRACQIFSDPPLTPNDSTGTNIPGVTAWSLADAVAGRHDINSALPLNRDLFRNPDQNLTDRDNQIAAYVSRLVQILKNPFAFANRLYVHIAGADEREVEVYTLSRIYFRVGTLYNPGDEVFFQTQWYRALTITATTPTDAVTWLPIDGPTIRVFAAEPAYPGRNQFVYNTVLKTLQWISESASTVHTPQIYALSIIGAIPGQTITTVPQVPQPSDAQFWRQKAGRITYDGTIAQQLRGLHDTSGVHSGVQQVDTVGLTAAGPLSIPFDVPLSAKTKYRFSALVRPSQTIDIPGGNNIVALSGTLQGVTFSGLFAPAALPGKPVPYNIPLPAGNWSVALSYTNLATPTTGFGTKIRLNGVDILEDTSPLLFQDALGAPLPPGQLVESSPVQFTTNGGQNTLELIWTYGNGQLHVRTLTLESRDVKIGRYAITLDVADGSGSVLTTHGTDIPSVDSSGERDIHAVMPFEFTPVRSTSAPTVIMNWLPTPNAMPLQVRQVNLERVDHVFPVPEVGGFLSWKQECMDRAERSALSAYNTLLSNIRQFALPTPDFTVDGTLWNKTSTEKWMSAIETYEPRLREETNVSSVALGRQYLVSSGSVVYNSGTFATGTKFFGTNVSDFSASPGAQIDQVGAFRLSFPGNIGRPALIPLGLYFDDKDVKQANPTVAQIPMVVALQPWMIEAGIYVAQPEFWSPEVVTTGLTVQPPVPDIYPDTLDAVGGFAEGSLDDWILKDTVTSKIVFNKGTLFNAVIAGSAGTQSGTNIVAFGTGALLDVIISGNAGTQSGTMSISFGTGTLADVVFTTGTLASTGTSSISFSAGTLATVTVDGGSYSDDGTFSGGFSSGAYA